MIKLYFFVIFFTVCNVFAASSVDNKIKQNKEILESNTEKKEYTSQKVKELADKIEAQNTNITNIEKDIKQINDDIEQHQKILEETKNKLDDLKSKSSNIINEKNTHEEEIVDTIIQEFSVSIALKLVSENNLQELIDNEVYTLLSQHSKDKVAKLNNSYNNIYTNAKNNQKELDKLSVYLEDRQRTKEKLTALKDKHNASLADLEQQHKSYQEELNKVLKQQDS